LDNWYQQLPVLYSPQICLLNEHMVGKHLWKCCKNYGPLVSHNCFAFESFYGYLVKLKGHNSNYTKSILFTIGHYHLQQLIASESGIKNDTWQGKLMEKVGINVKEIVNKY